jgi:hypothetical protein
LKGFFTARNAKGLAPFAVNCLNFDFSECLNFDFRMILMILMIPAGTQTNHKNQTNHTKITVTEYLAHCGKGMQHLDIKDGTL